MSCSRTQRSDASVARTPNTSILRHLHLYWRPLNGYYGKSKDQYKMSHKAAFHQGLHCFLRLKQPSGTEIHHNLETSTSDPLNYKMYNSILIVSIYVRKSIKGLKYMFGGAGRKHLQKRPIWAPMIENLTLLHADKGADQPVHTLSLISAFAIHLKLHTL